MRRKRFRYPGPRPDGSLPAGPGLAICPEPGCDAIVKDGIGLQGHLGVTHRKGRFDPVAAGKKSVRVRRAKKAKQEASKS